jgi:hypothetical protein
MGSEGLMIYQREATEEKRVMTAWYRDRISQRRRRLREGNEM